MCKGGDLCDRLFDQGGFTEEEAKVILRKVVSAIIHMHETNVVHRDIKPENILLETNDIDSEIKIIDFGLSKHYGGKLMTSFVGTPYYVAPEVLKGAYGKECDIWAIGVLMYVVLSGCLPFTGDKSDAIY